jgi:hypothetical protein
MRKGPRVPPPRSRLDDAEARLERKRHQEEAALSSGLVEIPGPLPPHLEEEIRHLAARAEADEARRHPEDRIVAIVPFAKGLAIETHGEKLAQRIADALARSRHARVERTFDDEGRRRILTCRLPAGKEEAP